MLLTEKEKAILNTRIETIGNELTALTERRRQKEILERKIVEYEDIVKIIRSEEQNLKQSKLFIIKHQNDKRVKDAQLIQDAMAVASHLVLKDRTIVPRFKTTNGSRPESNLVVTMGHRELLLNLVEGTGVQESISCLTSISVLSATPFIKTLLYDEHFSSISPQNTENLSRSLNELVDGKIQMILIEQKNEIVEHCNYRLFQIINENGKSKVVTYDVDLDGNKTLVE